MLQPYLPIGKAVRVILMEHSNKPSNSQVKKLGFEGENGRKNLSYSSESPGASFPRAELEAI